MDFARIEMMLNKIQTHRALCIQRWRDNARYLALNRWFDNQLTTGTPSDGRVPDDGSLKYPLVDFTAGTSMRRSANVISTMLLGDIEDDLIEVLPPEGVNADFSAITRRVNQAIKRYESNFDIAKRQYFQDCRSFGNAGIGYYYNKGEGYTFVTYGVDTLGFYVENGKVTAYADYRFMTGLEVNERFGKEYFKEKDALNRMVMVNRLFMRNDLFDPNDKLTNNRYEWVSYWVIDGIQEVAKADYFRSSPIKINREDLEVGEWYGRGKAEPLINSLVALNRAILLSVIGGEKMIDPAVWVYVSGQMNKMTLDRRPGAANPINIMDAPGGNPMGTIGDMRDPSALLQFVVPYLQKQISTAYNIDELFDLNAGGGQMTAREAIIRRDMRSSVISSEFGGHKRVFFELFNDLLDDMRRRGYFDDVLDGLELPQDGDWKRIVFNGDFDLMNRTKKSSRALEYVNNMIPLIQVFPELRQANNAWQIASDIEKGAGVDNYLSTEEEYDKMLKAMMVQQQQMSALEAEKTAAEIEKDTGNVGIGTNLSANVS